MKRKSVISLILRGWAKPLENGFVPPLDESDGDVGVRVPEFYMCVKDTGTKYQLWISDFNIDGTFTRVHPFIISHTKTMTRTREDGKEEVFSACIKHDDTRYLGGNKSSSVVATKLLNLILDLVLISFLIKLELIKKLTIIRKEVVMDKIQIKLFVCFCLAVTLITLLRLALVALILIGFGRILVLVSASLPQLNLIK